MTAETDDRSALAIEAARIRESLGRSDTLVRLFDYLLKQTLAGKTPKEIEFAQDVFGRGTRADGDDASVRVSIHRLRKKLESIYLGQRGPRLSIPKGEYRLCLDEPPLRIDDVDAPASPEPDDRPRILARSGWIIAILLAGLALSLLALGSLLFSRQGARTIERSVVWRQMDHDGRPLFIAAGDYYIAGGPDGDGQVARPLRGDSADPRQNPEAAVPGDPGRMGRYVGLNVRVLPAGMADALGKILPVTTRLGPDSPGRPIMMNMSQFEPEVLRDSDVIYIGQLAALDALQDPVFASSGFRFDVEADTLVDKATGRHFVADRAVEAEDHSPHRDYAYLALLPGPAGNSILILAGMREAAVKQVAQLVVDPVELKRLAEKVGDASAFEALYEVRTLGDLNLGSSLVVARPLEHNALLRLRPAPPATHPPTPASTTNVRRP